MIKIISPSLASLLLLLTSCTAPKTPLNKSPETPTPTSNTSTPNDARISDLLQGNWTTQGQDGWTFTLHFDTHHYRHGMSNLKFGPKENTSGGEWTLNDGLLVLDRQEFGPAKYRIIQITSTTLTLRKESATANQIWLRMRQN